MIKNPLFLLALIFVSLLGASCTTEEVPPEDIRDNRYSFFFAGHLYGKPGTEAIGIYSPFKEKYDLIRNWSKMEFGVTGGDNTQHGWVEEWDSLESDVEELGLPMYYSVGNHDHLNIDNFETRYGETLSYFTYDNDLFIILDPYPYWIIDPEQLDMIEEAISSNPGVDNIFVFFHYVIWWDWDNIFSDLYVNSGYNGHVPRADTVNFWTEVEPQFNGLPQPVYFFAGDMGAAYNKPGFMYYNYDNITLVGSGMGAGTQDNFVIINIDDEKNVTFDLIALGEDDIKAWGKLEDFILP